MSSTCIFVSLVGFAKNQEDSEELRQIERETRARRPRFGRFRDFLVVGRVKRVFYTVMIQCYQYIHDKAQCYENHMAFNDRRPTSRWEDRNTPNTRGGNVAANTRNEDQARLYGLARKETTEALDVMVI
ncbi:hypothetical protein HAX54_028151, partial [Datura stramonium]|nr:hypothetical protein [Datura stramonium]